MSAILDDIYDMFDRWFRTDCFDVADDFIAGSQVEGAPDDVLLAYLTATLPAKSKLPSRPAFYEKCEAKLGAEILRGLK